MIRRPTRQSKEVKVEVITKDTEEEEEEAGEDDVVEYINGHKVRKQNGGFLQRVILMLRFFPLVSLDEC